MSDDGTDNYSVTGSSHSGGCGSGTTPAIILQFTPLVARTVDTKVNMQQVLNKDRFSKIIIRHCSPLFSVYIGSLCRHFNLQLLENALIVFCGCGSFFLFHPLLARNLPREERFLLGHRHRLAVKGWKSERAIPLFLNCS